MLQQAVFVRIAPQEHFVLSVLNHQFIAVLVRLVETLGNRMFRRVTTVQRDHFVKTKVHICQQSVFPELTRIKQHPQNVLFVHKEHTLVHGEAKILPIVKFVQRDHIVHWDHLVQFFAMQEHIIVMRDV
jgi:hypothetical protein